MENKLYDKWIRVLVPMTLIVSSIYFQQEILVPFSIVKIFFILKNVVIIFLTFELGRFLILKIHLRFPTLKQTKIRLLYSFIAAFFIAFILLTISTIITRIFVYKPFSIYNESVINFVQCVWIAFLIVTPIEIIFNYNRLIENEFQKKELIRQNLQAQLNTLQAQINPHFLFNTLNNLSSLIIKDPVKAEDFVLKLSKVYRYILKNNKGKFISVVNELQFLDSYLHLVKARFANCINININVDDDFLVYLLPPLTLQILIENAIKHNSFSEEIPLSIKIYSSEKNLTVTNIVRKKILRADYSGTGLLNLVDRFKLLSLPPVTISNDGTNFTVTIPLTKPFKIDSLNYRG